LREAKALLPELPGAKRKRYVADYALTPYDASVLADDLSLGSYFEETAKAGAAANPAVKPKPLANWILNDLTAALSAAGKPVEESPVTPAALVELVSVIESGKISGKQGKEVFAEMFAAGKSADAVIKERGLEQVSDTGALEKFCDEVIAANPKVVADVKGGNAGAINFLKGQVMKLSKGKANPVAVGEILERKLAA
jgi:aspartyl-tRNA(Asn)/glutamyl-tRNA(Gln) amidotransferase subunit B